MAKWKIHPVAETYPLMSEAELEALTEDIKDNGLKRAIVRYQGQILDGRNRLIACERAGIEPRFEDYEGEDPAAHARSLNLNRDLTSAQRAIVAARQLPFFEALAAKRKKAGKTISPDGAEGQARDQAAKHFRVGKNQVQQAKAILAEASDLVEQVLSRTLAIAPAYEQLQQRRKEVERKKKDAILIDQYREAISNGEMKFEEAMQKALDEAREEKMRIEAEADARSRWLKSFDEHLKWFETFLHRDLPDREEQLPWYTIPDSPGLFDHGITPERIQAVVADLVLLARVTFGGQSHGNDGQGDKKAGNAHRQRPAR
jgi:hypothetical protein